MLGCRPKVGSIHRYGGDMLKQKNSLQKSNMLKYSTCRHYVISNRLILTSNISKYISSSGILKLQKTYTKKVPYDSKNVNLYDVLGVASKATQSEIKSAYYQLSMTYHPDKNLGSPSAALKFREITEAYEILGNYSFRRKYDRGLLTDEIGRSMQPDMTSSNTDETMPLYERRRFQARAPPPSGRSHIYDFDEWTQKHYEKLLHRRKVAWNQTVEKEIKSRTAIHEYNLLVVLGAMLFSIFSLVLFSVIREKIILLPSSTSSELKSEKKYDVD